MATRTCTITAALAMLLCCGPPAAADDEQAGFAMRRASVFGEERRKDFNNLMVGHRVWCTTEPDRTVRVEAPALLGGLRVVAGHLVPRHRGDEERSTTT